MRIVVKVGTSTLAHPSGLINIRRVEELCKVMSDLKNAGHDIILVTSGAIGMGAGKLQLSERPRDVAAKQAAATATAGVGEMLGMILPLVLMFVVFYFLLIRPQRKQQKELEKFRNALKKGDKVVTIGGIYGEVAEIKDRTVIIKVDGETKLRVDKNSLVKDFSETQQQ